MPKPETPKAPDVTLTITAEEFDTLLFALGVATGAASNIRTPALVHGFLRLLNKINKGNPNFRPYSVPSDDNGGEPHVHAV